MNPFSTAKLFAIAFVLGLLGGPFVGDLVGSTIPPFSWFDVLLMFIGSVVGVVLILGLQLLTKNYAAVHAFRRFFSLIGVSMFASGLYVIAMDVVVSTFTPSTAFLLANGIGTVIGTLLIKTDMPSG